mgnify:CR=1 FL=1
MNKEQSKDVMDDIEVRAKRIVEFLEANNVTDIFFIRGNKGAVANLAFTKNEDDRRALIEYARAYLKAFEKVEDQEAERIFRTFVERKTKGQESKADYFV